MTYIPVQSLNMMDPYRQYVEREDGSIRVTTTKGKEGIPYFIDYEYLEQFEDCLQYTLKWNKVNWPYLYLRYKTKKGTETWKEACRFITELNLKEKLTRWDYILQKDGDFMNLQKDNIVVIKGDTDLAKQMRTWLKENPFNRNPYPGIYWHQLTGQWAGYSDKYKILVGLFETPEAAYAASKAREDWYNNPVNV